MNQLPIIYQERFTFDPLFDPYLVPLLERSIFYPKFSKLSFEKYFEYFRIFISRIFLKFEIEQWKGKIMKRKICEDFSDNFAEANQNTESDDDFNKLFPVHVDSTFDFFTHLRQRLTQEWPF